MQIIITVREDEILLTIGKVNIIQIDTGRFIQTKRGNNHTAICNPPIE